MSQFSSLGPWVIDYIATDNFSFITIVNGLQAKDSGIGTTKPLPSNCHLSISI